MCCFWQSYQRQVHLSIDLQVYTKLGTYDIQLNEKLSNCYQVFSHFFLFILGLVLDKTFASE